MIHIQNYNNIFLEDLLLCKNLSSICQFYDIKGLDYRIQRIEIESIIMISLMGENRRKNQTL